MSRRKKAPSPGLLLKTSRRRFLASAAACAATLPLAQAFDRARSLADAGTEHTRFFALRTHHGTDRPIWIPKSPGFTAESDEPEGTDLPLSSLTFDYDDCLMKPFAGSPLVDKMTVIDGLDVAVNVVLNNHTTGGHHQSESNLTGAVANGAATGRSPGGHPSLDFHISQELLDGDRHLSLGIRRYDASRGWKTPSVKSDGNDVPLILSPHDAFNEAGLGEIEPPSGDLGPDLSALDERMRLFSIESARRLRSQLNGVERDKLDAHLDGLENLAAQITRQPQASCGVLERPGENGPYRGDDPADVEQTVRLQARVIAHAFACGTSRVASLNILDDNDNVPMNLPGFDRGGEGTLHNLVHKWTKDRNQRARPGYIQAQQWNSFLAHIVMEEMDALPDPFDPAGGTVLDNTFLYWHNEFGHFDHRRGNLPTVVAGSAGGRLRVGRYIRLRDFEGNSKVPGDRMVPHNRLLTSVLHTMGFTDKTFFGEREIGDDPGRYPAFHGPLEELMT